MDDDISELIARQCVIAGMIMEDINPLAVSRLPTKGADLDATLSILEQGSRDAHVLIQSAQVLARRRLDARIAVDSSND